MRFGSEIAEDETQSIQKYFVETHQWKRLYAGEIDIVYGPKGSGKSALYSLLASDEKASEQFSNNVLLIPAESVKGGSVLRGLSEDPPPSEEYFVVLWKLYCLTLIGKAFREYGVEKAYGKQLIQSLEEVGLLPRVIKDLNGALKAAWDYLRRKFSRQTSAEELEASIDPSSGAPTFKRRSEFKEETPQERLAQIPIDELLGIASEALEAEGFNLWILFDRLDVAFLGKPELERNALRALFRTYRDFQGLGRLTLKLFVRDDIWKRITSGGFAEASHIRRTTSITWDTQELVNLLVRRFLWNTAFIEYLNLDGASVLSDYSAQLSLLEKILPEEIDKRTTTISWLIGRVADGTGKSAPRELIHLVECARQIQIARLERGEASLPDQKLFEKTSIEQAMPLVSKVRLEQTLFAEYPEIEPYVRKLENGKSEHTSSTLAKIWEMDQNAATDMATKLVDIGFFDPRQSGVNQTYWVPFLYRPALNLTTGRALQIEPAQPSL